MHKIGLFKIWKKNWRINLNFWQLQHVLISPVQPGLHRCFLHSVCFADTGLSTQSTAQLMNLQCKREKLVLLCAETLQQDGGWSGLVPPRVITQWSHDIRKGTCENSWLKTKCLFPSHWLYGNMYNWSRHEEISDSPDDEGGAACFSITLCWR